MRLICLLMPLLASEAMAQLPPSSADPSSATQPADGSSTTVIPPYSASLDTAAAAAPSQIATTPDQDHWYALYPGKKFGLQLDLGAPDGAGLTAVFRPWWFLRANAGFAYNVIGTGIRGGLSLMPVQWAVTPSLNFDLGHYFSGDLTKTVTTSNPAEKALLANAAYNFWSLQIGLEFGSQQSFLFYLRGGIVHISDTLPGADLTRFMNSTGVTASRPGDGYRVGDADVTALLPCFSLGVIVYLF